MTEQVKKELNRQQRTENIEREKKKWFRRGTKNKKIKVRELIKKEIRKNEEKIVEEIKQDKGGKEFWKNIRKISGKEVKKQELRIYDEDEKELEEIEVGKRIVRFWKQTYQTHQNKINEYWNQVEKRNVRIKVKWIE